MMHEQIDDQIIERYARNQLEPAERQAFEEHFFDCDECFEKLQAMDRLIAGMRDAGARGLLGNSASSDSTPTRGWRTWMLPSLAVSTCAAIVFAIWAAWLSVRVISLRQELTEATTGLRAQQDSRAALEQQMARSNQAEINLPLVMLQATRDVRGAPNEAVLPAGAQHLALWIELPPGISGPFALEIETADGRPVQTFENLTRNGYGALAVSLPAEALQSGMYGVRLSRQEPSPGTLVAEYRLKIHRP